MRFTKSHARNSIKYMHLVILLLLSCLSYGGEFEERVSIYKNALENEQNIEVVYSDLNNYWRSLVDETPKHISNIKVLTSEKHGVVANDKIVKHFENLIIIGNLRSEFIKKQGVQLEASMNLETLLDLKRELQLTPMKFIAYSILKLKYVKDNLQSGFKGIKVLLKDLITLFLYLLIPFILWLFLKRIKKELASSLIELKRNRFKTKQNYNKYRLVQILESYSLNVGMYFVFKSLRNDDSSFFFFFAVAEIYFLYRIVRTVAYYSFGYIFDRYINKGEQNDFEAKKKVYARKLGLLFFIYSLLIHSVQYIGGIGITFLLLQWLIKLITFIVLIWIASSWKLEISKFLLGRKNDFIAKFLSRLVIGYKVYFFALPALIYVISIKILLELLKLLEQFDFVKQISAKVFKQKLISTERFVEADVVNIPEEYKQSFENFSNSDFFLRKKSSFEEINSYIRKWKENSDEENSVAIYGQPGSGKSSLISELKKSKKDINVIHHRIEKRLTTEVDLVKEIALLLNIEDCESLAPLLLEDKNLKKTVILLEGCHNLFLSKLYGFKAYTKLLEIINARFQNIFWIGVFNYNSYIYLNAIYGRNESFRYQVELKAWKEKELQEMILQRHGKTGYNLSFNKILQAISNSFDNESVDEAKEQFFRLLWEQSEGNPELATYLWLSSLTFRPGKRIDVGLPQNDELKDITNFSDSSLFVYAALCRHESLSVKEAVLATSLAEGVVRHAMKLGFENNFLMKDEFGKYHFVVRYQYRILNYLKKKNFIIGS